MSADRPTLAETLYVIHEGRWVSGIPWGTPPERAWRGPYEALANAAGHWFLDRLALHPPKCSGSGAYGAHGALYCPPCSEATRQWVVWTPAHALRGDEVEATL